MILRKSGLYVVDEVGSGEEAIRALKEVDYDLAILDHHMGEVSGLNVMQWFFEQKMQIPVIVLSGAGSDTIAVEMMKLGATDYVRKDQMELNRFPAFVNTTIEAFRSRRERQRGGVSIGRVMQKSDVIGLLENTSASFSRSAEAVIGLISDEFDEYRSRVRPNLAPSAQSDIDKIMKNFQEQLKLVSLFTKTLADLAFIARAHRGPGLPNEGSGNMLRGNAGRIDESDLQIE